MEDKCLKNSISVFLEEAMLVKSFRLGKMRISEVPILLIRVELRKTSSLCIFLKKPSNILVKATLCHQRVKGEKSSLTLSSTVMFSQLLKRHKQ